jgi:hypothetical protein
LGPIFVTAAGIVIVVNGKFRNAESSIVDTPIPSDTDDKMVESINEYWPMVTTESGIVIEVKFIHPLNALLPIPVIPLIIVTFVKLVIPLQEFSNIAPV